MKVENTVSEGGSAAQTSSWRAPPASTPYRRAIVSRYALRGVTTLRIKL